MNASVKTDQKGFFDFRNLDADKKYMASIDSDDPTLVGKAKYYLADGKGVISRVTNQNGQQKYMFKNLPIDPNAVSYTHLDVYKRQ